MFKVITCNIITEHEFALYDIICAVENAYEWYFGM